MTARVLEVIIDGTVQGRLHLNLTEGITISKNKLNGNIKKINTCLLNPRANYALYGLKEYVISLKKSLEYHTNKNVDILERKIDPKVEKLYQKYLKKRQKFRNYAQYNEKKVLD